VPYGIRATVIVVGGGSSAGQKAVFPPEMASHVRVIVWDGRHFSIAISPAINFLYES
jgi:hypothetical protein